jgi:RHS repeat-associated protein
MGNLTSMTDRKGKVTSYTYDALNRLRTITHADGSVITMVWDAGNRVRQVIDTANGTITLDYDDLDRLTRETSPQGQIEYDYDDAGRRTQLTVAGRDPIMYSYDDADRLTRIEQGSVAIDFTFDAADRRATVTWPNGIVGTYALDDADQLLSIVYDRGTTRVGEVGYTYDLSGRSVGQSGSLANLMMPATVNAATYDAANRLTNWGDESLSYDDNGNLISHGGATYGWNTRDELISTSAGAGSFAYDAFGRRTSRTIAGSILSYLHDGMNPVLVNDSLMLSGFGIDEFYATLSPDGATSHLKDALGSTRLLTDGDGNSTANYGYTPYGEGTRAGGSETPFQFTGRENDGASELYYYRARYYNARLGRFIQSDPAGLSGGINTFAYVEGNPMSYVDPYGLWAIGDPLPQWLVDGAAGFGAGLTGGLVGDGASVNQCSKAYQWSSWAGITAGLGVPIGRAVYVVKVSKLPTSGMGAREIVAARNALKAYFRGRPLSQWMPKWNPRLGYPTYEELLERNGGDIARLIEHAGNTSTGWTRGLLGGGAAKAGNSVREALEDACGCGS